MNPRAWITRAQATAIPAHGLVAPRRPSRRSLVTGAAAGAVVIACGTAVFEGIGTTDEGWFLLVSHSVAHGAVLYRDVQYPATPLAAYTAGLAMSIMGTHFWVLEALLFLTFGLTVWVTQRIARFFGLGRTGRALVVLAECALASPATYGHSISLYQPLAELLLLVCLLCFLIWEADAFDSPGSTLKGRLAGLAAPAAAGLAFATKQNVGLPAVVALGVAAAPVIRRHMPGTSRVRVPLLAAGVFMLFAGLPLAVVAASGGWSPFVEDAFLAHLRWRGTASVAYHPGLETFIRSVAHAGSAHGLAVAVVFSQFLIFPVALTALIAVTAASERHARSRPVALLAFLIASSVSLVPRADVVHLQFVAPLFVVATAVAFRFLSQNRHPKWLEHGAATALLAVVLGLAISVIGTAVQRSVRMSHLPYYEGAVVAPDDERRLEEWGTQLRTRVRGKKALLLTDQAGIAYLVSGIENPTRFYYPVRSDLGLTGESDIVHAIADGALDYVCLKPYPTPSLRPTAIEHEAARTMDRVADLGFCELFARPTRSEPHP